MNRTPIWLLFLLSVTLTACSLSLFDAQVRTHAIALADLDGDGDLDAVLANDQNLGPVPDPIWWNDGSGTFTDSGQRLDEEIPGSHHVSTGDFDGNGDEDILFGVSGGGWFLRNRGVGQFLPGSYLNANNIYMGPVPVAVGDLDRDGDLDALIAVCCGTFTQGSSQRTYFPPSQRVLFNDGSGRFTLNSQSLSDFGTRAVALGDLDGDGDLDAFMGNSFSTRDANGTQNFNEPNTIWFNDGTGQFVDSGQRLGSSGTNAVVLGDLDGDGDLDAWIGNGGFSSNSSADEVWFNDGLGNFTDSGQALGDALTRFVYLNDLDGDGDLDAVVESQRSVQLWLNDGSGAFTKSKQNLSYSSDCAAAPGDVDGDGDIDIVAGCAEKKVLVWLNDGMGKFK